MTGRERLTAILNKQPVDRLAWTTLVDGNTLGILPDEMRGMSDIDFYRYLGCDIFLLNGGVGASPGFAWPKEVTVSSRQDNGKTIHELQTPEGTLTSINRGSHPIKYSIASLEDINLYQSRSGKTCNLRRKTTVKDMRGSMLL